MDEQAVKEVCERMARELEAEANGTRPVSLNGYTARCGRWAEGLADDAAGNIPNGLHAIVGDLVAWYGTPAVLEAVANAAGKERRVAVKLAEVSSQLAALSREVLNGGKRSGLPKLVETRCEWVGQLAATFQEGSE